MPRLFFALSMPAAVRRSVVEISAHTDFTNARPIADQNLHLTLAFLGEIESKFVAGIRADAGTLKMTCFSLSLTELGWFRRNHIAWLGPREVPHALNTLATTLVKITGATEIGSFKPHITLARRVVTQPKFSPILPIVWQVEDFSLLESTIDQHGVRYTPISHWPLD